MQTRISDKNQTSILFEEVASKLDNLKRKRRKTLKSETLSFNNQTSLDGLVKITYDLTDKDFEYLYAYILKRQGCHKVKVTGGDNDEGVDIKAYKDGKWYFIQCKQWSELYINPKQAGEYIGVIHSKQKKFPNGIFRYVTTSYLNEDSRTLLKDNHIEILDNKDLIGLCNEYNLLSDDGWKQMIKEIQLMRISDLREISPENGFSELKKRRLKEVLNHIPNLKYAKIINVSNSRHPFFQYWNLI